MHCLWKFLHLDLDYKMDFGQHLELALVLKSFSQKMGRFKKNIMKIHTTLDKDVIDLMNCFMSVVIFTLGISWLYAQ